jgi:hemerythrin-like domain-containing protein
MLHDDFEGERRRVERVLDILEDGARRLEARSYIPLSVLRDAVGFIGATEDAAYDAARNNEVEPPLSSCVEQHRAAQSPLHGMTEALAALEGGDAAAAARFSRCAREYVQLRREHLRLDDRLFLRAVVHGAKTDAQATPVESVESAATRQRYERLVEAADALDLGPRPPLARAVRSK